MFNQYRLLIFTEIVREYFLIKIQILQMKLKKLFDPQPKSVFPPQEVTIARPSFLLTYQSRRKFGSYYINRLTI